METSTKSLYRSIAPHIRHQLPSFISQNNEAFVDFIEAYYEFMESEGGPLWITSVAANRTALDASVGEFFEHFRKKYLFGIPRDVLEDKSNLIKNIRDFYSAKGTEKAVRLLFRILYNEEIDVSYGADSLLRTSDGRWSTQRLITFDASANDDLIYKLENRRIAALLVEIDVTGAVGDFVVGETVVQFNTQDDTPSGVVYSYDAGEQLLRVTDFKTAFKFGGTITGSTSGATSTAGNIVSLSGYATVEGIQAKHTDDPLVVSVQALVSNTSGTFLPNVIFSTIDPDGPYVKYELLGQVTNIQIINQGTGYEQDTPIEIVSQNGGSGFVANIDGVNLNQTPISGSFNFDLSTEHDGAEYGFAGTKYYTALKYSSADASTLSNFVSRGSRLMIDGDVRYVAQVTDNTLDLDLPIDENTVINPVSIADLDANGEIASIKITSQGRGYSAVNLPEFTLANSGNGDAVIAAVVSGLYVSDGKYIGDFGQLSSSMRLQDGVEFQEYAYTIRSSIPVKQYIETLKKTVHPGGLYVAGEIRIITSDSNVLRLYEKFKPLRVNYVEPESPSSRRFVEHSILINESITFTQVDEAVEFGKTNYGYLIAPSRIKENYRIGPISDHQYISIQDLHDAAVDLYTVNKRYYRSSEAWITTNGLNNQVIGFYADDEISTISEEPIGPFS